MELPWYSQEEGNSGIESFIFQRLSVIFIHCSRHQSLIRSLMTRSPTPDAFRKPSVAAPPVTPPRVATASAGDLDYRPSYKAAALAGLGVFILYVFTLGPSTAMWDTSEYIAAAYIFGIPHPPGNPFFVILGRFFSILPIAPSIAMRVNLLAAICSAVSAAMWFLVTERVLVAWLSERWHRIIGGVLASLIGATSFTVWSQSVVNEKVYTVSLVGVAIIAWLTVKWCDDPDGPKSDKLLILIAYLLGLGYANHMAGFIAAPAVGLAVLLQRPRVLLRWKVLVACAGALVIGMTPFLTQPIRAAYFPAVNEGEPTGCRTEFAWSCTFSKETWTAFKYNFDRGQYSKPPLSERQAPFVKQLEMWWLYFKWQWLRDPYSEAPRMQAMLGAIFFMLGLFGGYVHWKRDRRSFAFFGPLMFTMTVLLIYYLNFKYGASQGGADCDVTIPCEVRDRDYFFLWSFSAWSVWAALGLVFVWESLAALVGSTKVKVGNQLIDLPRQDSWAKTSPVLAIALIPLFANWYSSERAGETDTRDFAHDMLNSVEPYGVLVTVGDNDTFPIWYAQEVEGIRRDVVLVNTSLANTDWYPRQIIRRPIFPYDKEKGPAVYRNQDWPLPTEPPLSLSLDEVDSIPLVQLLDRPMQFSVPGTELVANVAKREFWKSDHLVLQIIKDSYGKRPVYLSRTAGPTPRELGLEEFTLTQGLAEKILYVVPKNPGPDTVRFESAWLDVKRSKVLWDSVYVGKASLIRKNKWIDFSSQGIPYLYVATGLTLGHALQVQGNLQDGRRVLNETATVAEAVKLEKGIGEPGLVQKIRDMAAIESTKTLLTPAETARGPGKAGRGGGDSR